jgi:transposase-like protein
MTERWTDERLDKMADTLNQTISAIGQLSQRTEVITTAVERLTDEIGAFPNEDSCLTIFFLVLQRDHAKHDRLISVAKN